MFTLISMRFVIVTVFVALICELPFSAHAQEAIDDYYLLRPLPAAYPPVWREYKRNLPPGVALSSLSPPEPNRRYTPPREVRLDYLAIPYEGSGYGRPCTYLDLPPVIWAGLVAPRPTTWLEGGMCPIDEAYDGFPIVREWKFADSFAFNAPVRRKTFDGQEFDASPMVQTRNGEPWLTLYWGRNLGLVESQHDWNPARLTTLQAFAGWRGFASKDYEFMLVTLPLPVIEGTVTEYINTRDFPNAPGGVYFYASTDQDRRILDSVTFKTNWSRTGKSFRSGGYVAVCRFYGSVSPGPNSHFYTASASECSQLKSLQVTTLPNDKPQLNYEGTVFFANVPIAPATVGQVPTCGRGSVPLYRAYNGGNGTNAVTGTRNFDGNHRFTTSRADIAAVVALGWVDEGVVMCVPEEPFRP